MTTYTVHVGEDYYEVEEFLDERDMLITRYRQGKAPGLPVRFESLTDHQQNEIIHKIIKIKNAQRSQRNPHGFQ
jgi:hypothetical protein